MFTAKSSKTTQGYCQPRRESVCHNLPLHTHNEDRFHHPQIFKLASRTDIEWVLNKDKKHYEIYQKNAKKLLQRQNSYSQINSRFTPATNLKIGTYDLIPNFVKQKKISKKLQPIRKGPFQIIDKPTDATYKPIVSNKKEIVQHRNNLLPYYPKEHALFELTQLYSFTGLKVVHDNSDNTKQETHGVNCSTQLLEPKNKEIKNTRLKSQEISNKHIPQKHGKRIRRKKLYHEKQKKDLNKDNHYDLEVNY